MFENTTIYHSGQWVQTVIWWDILYVDSDTIHSVSENGVIMMATVSWLVTLQIVIMKPKVLPVITKLTSSRVTLYTAGHMHTVVPHCSHSGAPGEQWARLCVFTLQGCVQAARLCRGSPVIMSTYHFQLGLQIPQIGQVELQWRLILEKIP